MIDWAQIDDALFDMDGACIWLDFDVKLWGQQLQEAMHRETGVSIEHAHSVTKHFYDESKGSLDHYNVAAWSLCTGINFEQLHQQHVGNIKMIPGVLDLFHWLRARGKRIGIVTDADLPLLRQKQRVQPGLFRLCDFVVSTSQLGFPKQDNRCWDALDRWLVKKRGMKAINRDRASFADDNEPILVSALSAGWNLEHLVYLQQRCSQQFREPSEVLPSANTLADLLPST